MKKLTILFLLLGSSAMIFGQQNETKHSPAKQAYLAKSKKQKTTAWILLGSGAGLMTTSFIIPRGELVYDGICIGPYCDDKYKNDGIKTAFFLAGAVSALGSIPFFIASGKNKRKAAAISVKNQVVPQTNNLGLVNRNVPSLNLKINF